MPILKFSFEQVMANFFRLGPYYCFALFIASAFYVAHRMLINRKTSVPARFFWASFFIALSLRIFLAYFEYGNGDVTGYLEVTEMTFAGKLVYAAPLKFGKFSIYPYPPLYLPVLPLCKYFSLLTSLPLSFVIKLPSIFTDMLFMAMFYSVFSQQQQRRYSALLLGLSPILITTCTVLGQIDVIPTLFSFAAYYLLRKDHSIRCHGLCPWLDAVLGRGVARGPRATGKWPSAARSLDRRWLFSALMLGTGIAVKHYPLILIPAFLAEFPSLKRKAEFLAAALFPLVFSLGAVSIFEPQGVLDNVLRYKGIVGGSWGFSGLFWALGVVLKKFLGPCLGYAMAGDAWSFYNSHGMFFFFLTIGLLYFTLFRKIGLLERIVYSIMAFYIFSSAVAPQYLVWILPFLFFGGFSFAPGFHFWAILWMAVYAPVAAQGRLHLDSFQYMYPLTGGLLWAYCFYHLGKAAIRRPQKFKAI